MTLTWTLALLACDSPDPKPVAPPSVEYVGTWKSRDETVRLVLTQDGHAQYTRGKWTNTGLVVGWGPEGFSLSAYPEPELHRVTVTPHEESDYWWMTVDDVALWRQTAEAAIAPHKPPE